MCEPPVEPRRCRKCGAEMGPAMRGSHCPACLFALALEPPEAPPAPEGVGPLHTQCRWLKATLAFVLGASLLAGAWWGYGPRRPAPEADTHNGSLPAVATLFAAGEAEDALLILTSELRVHPTNSLASERLLSALMYRPWPRLIGEPLYAGPDLLAAHGGPGGRWLATASPGRKPLLWDLQTQQQRELPAGLTGMTGVTFCLQDQSLTALAGTRAALWSLEHEPRLLGTFESPQTLQTVLLRPGRPAALALSSDHALRVWDLNTGRAAADSLRADTWPGIPDSLWSNCDGLELTPEGNRLLLLSGARRVVLVDLLAGKSQPQGQSNTVAVRACLTAAARAVWVEEPPHALSTWDLVSGERLAGPVDLGGPLAQLAFSPDGERAATWSEKQPVIIRAARSAQPLLALPVGRETGLTSLGFSPTGQHLFTVDQGGCVRVWRARDGLPSVEPIFVPGGVLAASFVGPSGTLAVLSRAGSLCFWDVRGLTARPLCLSPGQDASGELNFTFDGKFLHAGARAWAAASGQPVVLSPGPRLLVRNKTSRTFTAGDGSTTLGFSGDWQRALTLGTNGTLQVWDVRQHAPISEPLAPPSAVLDAVLDADGHRLAARGQDGAVWLWALPPKVEVAPSWMLRLAEATRDASAWLSLKRELQAVKPGGALEEWIAWYIAEPGRRPLAPGLSD